VVDRVVIPDTDDDIAKNALREAFKMTLGPGNVNDRLAAARLVLAYTKPRPPTVGETRDLLTANGDTERLLAALLGPSRGRGTKAGTALSREPQGPLGQRRRDMGTIFREGSPQREPPLAVLGSLGALMAICKRLY
jgi:hypothetical protein